MATTIHEVLAVNIQNIDSATAAANRTFTTTRAMRVFDMRAYCVTAAPAGAASTLTVSNGVNVITSVATPNPPVANTTYRMGQEIANSTTDDARMLVAAGGTIVFNAGTADNFDITAFCVVD